MLPPFIFECETVFHRVQIRVGESWIDINILL